jgi:hypothetical protein
MRREQEHIKESNKIVITEDDFIELFKNMKELRDHVSAAKIQATREEQAKKAEQKRALAQAQTEQEYEREDYNLGRRNVQSHSATSWHYHKT